MASNMLELDRRCTTIDNEAREDFSKIIEVKMRNLTIDDEFHETSEISVIFFSDCHR